jgi:hypothetical protein
VAVEAEQNEEGRKKWRLISTKLFNRCRSSYQGADPARAPIAVNTFVVKNFNGSGSLLI